MNGRRQAGISIIEVIVTLGILALLLGLGMPEFRAYQQNTQMRVAADAVLNGIQTTRNESIRRNSTYEFTLHDGTAWDICPVNDPYPCSPALQQRSAAEGSENATATTLPAGADTIAFNGMGRVVTNANGSASLQQVLINNPKATGAQARRLTIQVQSGGAVRLCDPQVAAGDPRACQ
jgi:type IV fimbrial biogenesis protein FimT